MVYVLQFFGNFKDFMLLILYLLFVRKYDHDYYGIIRNEEFFLNVPAFFHFNIVLASSQVS